MKPDDLLNYKEAVRNLCVYSAQVQILADRLNEKETGKMLAYSLSKIRSYRGFVLEDLYRMGVNVDRIVFFEDNEFFGFSIKQGRIYITGDRGSVWDTCCKWIYGFPDSANWYQFGVAMFAICLAFPEIIDLEKFYPHNIIYDLEAA